MKSSCHTKQIPSLKRIEGQIRGITKMIEEKKYCIDILNQIKELLQENPEGVLIIEGYASSDGDDAYNIELSIKRAQAVKAYLVEIGVSKDRLEVRGLGEAEPISDNVSKEGRAENRRVQFLPKLKVLFLQ